MSSDKTTTTSEERVPVLPSAAGLAFGAGLTGKPRCRHGEHDYEAAEHMPSGATYCYCRRCGDVFDLVRRERESRERQA